MGVMGHSMKSVKNEIACGILVVAKDSNSTLSHWRPRGPSLKLLPYFSRSIALTAAAGHTAILVAAHGR